MWPWEASRRSDLPDVRTPSSTAGACVRGCSRGYCAGGRTFPVARTCGRWEAKRGAPPRSPFWIPWARAQPALISQPCPTHIRVAIRVAYEPTPESGFAVEDFVA